MATSFVTASRRARSGPSSIAGIGVVVVLIALAGCASLAEMVATPRVSVAELSLVEAGFDQQRFRLQLDVENTNPFPLPLARIDYALDLAGLRFATGASDQTVTIGASASERISLELQTDLMTSAIQLGRLFIGGMPESIDYRITGGLAVDFPGASLLRFDESGDVALTRN